MPGFRHRLTARQRRAYDRSETLTAVRVRLSPRAARAVQLLEWALGQADRARTQRVAQVICDEICTVLGVPPVRVVVKATRPSNQRGELHGLYQSAGRSQLISVWMLTAKRGQVVAYRTFLRTLLHEVCHHLDYELFQLGDSFHTTGFFRRESSLVHQLCGAAERAARAAVEDTPEP